MQDYGQQFNMIAASWINFMIHDWIDHQENLDEVLRTYIHPPFITNSLLFNHKNYKASCSLLLQKKFKDGCSISNCSVLKLEFSILTIWCSWSSGSGGHCSVVCGSPVSIEELQILRHKGSCRIQQRHRSPQHSNSVVVRSPIPLRVSSGENQME